MDNSNTRKKEPKYYPPIHSFPLYGLIVCGIILVLIGIYLKVKGIKFLGETGGESFGINGPATICFGIAILVFPIYTLIAQYKEKKRFDNNIF
jgi:hypothetical protein